MSKTDKTDPAWVKTASGNQGVTYIANHDHRTGPCDLPNDHLAALRNWGTTRCTWSETTQLRYTRFFSCGCPLCTAQYERRSERRRDRHNTRRILHARTFDQ